MDTKKKILLICGRSKEIVNFRSELISFLISKDYDVSVISADEDKKERIVALGANFYCAKYDNRSTNVFSNLVLTNKFYKIIKQVNPDVVFTFQAKANVFGTKAAKKAGVKKIYSMIEGLGDAFENKLIRSILIPLYRTGLNCSEKVFFLNESDKEYFENKKMSSKDKNILVHGIGIDTDSYKPDFNSPKKNKVILIARLLQKKGIYDYCELASLVKSVRSDITFELFGEEGQIKRSDIKSYIDKNIIDYRGYSDNIKEHLLDSDILLSLSKYKEGFPRVILEAMALGKPTVATNIVGNKDAVIDGKTGFLLNVDDLNAFKYKILELLDDDNLRIKLGKTAREECVKRYDSKIINGQILKIIES